MRPEDCVQQSKQAGQLSALIRANLPTVLMSISSFDVVKKTQV
jgi:hypothetical protein